MSYNQRTYDQRAAGFHAATPWWPTNASPYASGWVDNRQGRNQPTGGGGTWRQQRQRQRQRDQYEYNQSFDDSWQPAAREPRQRSQHGQWRDYAHGPTDQLAQDIRDAHKTSMRAAAALVAAQERMRKVATQKQTAIDWLATIEAKFVKAEEDVKDHKAKLEEGTAAEAALQNQLARREDTSTSQDAEFSDAFSDSNTDHLAAVMAKFADKTSADIQEIIRAVQACNLCAPTQPDCAADVAAMAAAPLVATQEVDKEAKETSVTAAASGGPAGPAGPTYGCAKGKGTAAATPYDGPKA